MCEVVFFLALGLAVLYLFRRPADGEWPPPDGCGSPFAPPRRRPR